MDIIDISNITVGDGPLRYRFMVDWLYKHHQKQPREQFHAIMLDDLKGPEKNNLGYFEVQHNKQTLESLLVDIYHQLDTEGNVLTERNIVNEW